MDLYLYLLYFRGNIHDHSEYLITSHEGQCRFTVWLWPPPPVPASLLYTVTSKNKFWPFLKKTLSNNCGDKSPSAPTLGQCEWYVCVDLFMLPWSTFGYYLVIFGACCSPPYTAFKKKTKTQIKRLNVGLETHCFLLLLMFCYCEINCCYLFFFFCGNIYRAKMTKTTKSDWPLVMEREQRFGESSSTASGTSMFESFTLRLREMWDLSTMLGKLEQSEESTFFIG